MNPLDNLPSAYKFTLKELSNKTGKPEHHLLIMALDGLFEKFSHSLLNSKSLGGSPQSNQTIYHQSPDYCQSQLEIIPKDGQLRILLRNDQGMFMTQHAYKNLAEALKALNEAPSIRNKWGWATITGNYPVVIAQKKPTHTPHLWLGQNTACKMFNSHSNNPHHYSLSTKLPMQEMCKVCISNYNQLNFCHMDVEIANGLVVGPIYDDAMF
ncbi:hypothetical protein [Acinetobacter gandensis]|uniref:hypothetical protein n=1 Tax=Acinetobacter gandensis TaxID=1443941 RepID=UPI003F547747